MHPQEALFQQGAQKAQENKAFSIVEDNPETRGYYYGLGLERGSEISALINMKSCPSQECVEMFLNGLRERLLQDFVAPPNTSGLPPT